MMEHFKEYLMYAPFVVRTDNNLLTCVLATPNLDAMGHQWVGALASFQLELEYQKGADNRAADALSQVPISHSWQDTLLKECLGAEAETEQGKMFFCIRNSLILNKGLMYINTALKGETQGVLAFVVPMGQCHMALNGVHRDAGHQGQQRTLALTQERFWWPMMAEDCRAIVRGCPCCKAFEGEVPRAPLCLIRAYAPLEPVHLDYTSIESTMELNKPPMVKNVLVMTGHFMRYALAVVMKDQMAKMVAKVFYECFIAVFGAPTKLSDRGANFMSALVEELCSTFGIQKCRTTAYQAQCNGQVEHFHQTLFCMIGKLSCNKKAQWEQHLPELLQA